MSRWSVAWTGSQEALVAATPDQVWAVLTDVTRIAEWSHECRGAAWLDGASGPAVGVRFRGTNKVGRFGWSRVCTVTDLDPGRTFGYRTNGGFPPDSTAWTFRLEPEAAGTRVTQSFEILKFPRVMELATVAFVPPHRDRAAALREDLVRLGEVAAGTGTVSS
jgi:uncharacterized protein YndB with AHSA1/START domain